jgi:hypothetical protein
MATGAMGQVVRYLRRVARPHAPDNLADGQLLTAFLTDRSVTLSARLAIIPCFGQPHIPQCLDAGTKTTGQFGGVLR